jgi:hypothetical protein
MAATNPVYAGMFDSSGWAMNYSGTQNASSSPANSVSPVTSAPGQSVSGAPFVGAGSDNTLLYLAAALAAYLVMK